MALARPSDLLMLAFHGDSTLVTLSKYGGSTYLSKGIRMPSAGPLGS